jgi:hypothetical protein
MNARSHMQGESRCRHVDARMGTISRTARSIHTRRAFDMQNDGAWPPCARRRNARAGQTGMVEAAGLNATWHCPADRRSNALGRPE